MTTDLDLEELVKSGAAQEVARLAMNDPNRKFVVFKSDTHVNLVDTKDLHELKVTIHQNGDIYVCRATENHERHVYNQPAIQEILHAYDKSDRIDDFPAELEAWGFKRDNRPTWHYINEEWGFMAVEKDRDGTIGLKTYRGKKRFEMPTIPKSRRLLGELFKLLGIEKGGIKE